MSDGANILAKLISDALTGKPVELGLGMQMRLPGMIKALRDDPQGRRVVFAEALGACIASDPAYADMVRAVIAAYDAEV